MPADRNAERSLHPGDFLAAPLRCFPPFALPVGGGLAFLALLVKRDLTLEILHLCVDPLPLPRIYPCSNNTNDLPLTTFQIPCDKVLVAFFRLEGWARLTDESKSDQRVRSFHSAVGRSESCILGLTGNGCWYIPIAAKRI
jgi:hypothetical protein